MADKKIVFEVEIKNVTKVTKLKEELKKLRKQQKLIEKDTAKNTKAGKNAAVQYSKNAKAISNKSKKLRELNKELRTGTQATGKVTKSNNFMAKQFIKGAAAIGIIIGAFRAVNRVVSGIVSVFTEFEFVMAKVNAVSGATEREFAALTETAEELGRTTFFTATQVGELMLNFSKLGFTAQEIQNAVQPTLDLATATGSDLARAATVAGAAVRGFGLDASETERVVDVMAVSFSSSAMNIEKWQTSMTKVAPIAKAAGFSIEDTAAIMSKLTDSGIEASIAGTSLRNILLKMQDPTSELSKRFGRTIHPLDDLVPAMKKFVSEGGSMADVMEVVDLRQAAAFEQMLTTADGTLELRDALLAAGGEGARMAGIVGDTLQGAFLKFTSALQGVSIQLMDNYAGGMQKAVEATAKWMNKLALNIDKIVALIGWIKKIAIALGIYKVGVMAANLATTLFATTTKSATAALVTFRTALARTGVGAFIVVLGDLITKYMSFNKEAKEATDWTEKLNKGMKDEEKSIGELEISLKRLVKAKKTIDKFSKEEVKNMDKTSLKYAKYSKQLIIATQETRTLNTAFKQNGQDLITLQTDIKNTQKKFSDLAIQMRNTAAIAVASKMSADIIEVKMTVDNVFDDLIANFKKAKTDIEAVDIWTMAHSLMSANWFDEFARGWPADIMALFNDDSEKMISAMRTIEDAVDDAGLSMGDFVKYMEPFSSGTEAMNKDLDVVDETLTKLFPNFKDFIKLVGEEPPSPKGVTGITDWGEEMKIQLNKVKSLYLDNTISQEQYKDMVLQTKADVLLAELRSLKDTKKNEKRILAIKTQALNIEMQIKDRAFQKKLEDLNLAHQAEQDEIIKQYTVNGQLTATGNQLLLQAEADYLIAKGKLHKDYKVKLLKNNSEILKNDIKLQKSQKEILDEQINAYSAVGSSLQELAGENESLNFVKEAGNKISMVANALSAISTLNTNLQTISNIKNAASENLDTSSTIAGTAADTLSLIPKAIGAILNQGGGDPYSALFRMVAMAALVAKVMGMYEKGGVIDEKFAAGGMVRGKSHAQGGEKFAVGGRVVELEGGEAVINKRSTSMYKDQLSAINQAGGGDKFADGGLLNMPSFATAKFSAINQEQQIQKVIVVESDITSTQKTVNVIESGARL